MRSGNRSKGVRVARTLLVRAGELTTVSSLVQFKLESIPPVPELRELRVFMMEKWAFRHRRDLLFVRRSPDSPVGNQDSRVNG